MDAGPPDAYATVSGRRIALDVAIIAHPPRARLVSAARLRQDVVARRVLRDIRSALSSHVPDRKSVILTLGAPIKVPISGDPEPADLANAMGVFHDKIGAEASAGEFYRRSMANSEQRCMDCRY